MHLPLSPLSSSPSSPPVESHRLLVILNLLPSLTAKSFPRVLLAPLPTPTTPPPSRSHHRPQNVPAPYIHCPFGHGRSTCYRFTSLVSLSLQTGLDSRQGFPRVDSRVGSDTATRSSFDGSPMTMTTVEAPHASQNDVYDPDDVGLQDSPLLEPQHPKLEPTPSPSPDGSESDDAKPVPSQGDAVLINLLGGGNALEVSRTAAKELLASDEEMTDGPEKGVEVSAVNGKAGYANELKALAAGALNKFNAVHTATAPMSPAEPSVGEFNVTPLLNGHERGASTAALPAMKTESQDECKRKMSPNLFSTQLGDELAPIQEQSPKSDKANGFTLPSITAQLGGQLKQLAEAATATADKDPNSVHRPSISQSPPGPPLFQMAHSHQGAQTSPPISPNDNFRRELPSSGRGSATATSPYYYNPRRPSLASEGPPYPAATPHDYSSSTTETPSTDQSGSTPSCIPAGIDRMSIDGITNPQIGGFQCTYPGCNAQPFQTQYLLNSHANVHSSNRPHYCPVKGCPRGEGGKGFKRKNEMIRHGLVHESPGYVCPYCVDREHKYPRPDNLQRHVRVHHVDKDKDDPQLREVLAQRPEGPSRGRRRRGGNN